MAYACNLTDYDIRPPLFKVHYYDGPPQITGVIMSVKIIRNQYWECPEVAVKYSMFTSAHEQRHVCRTLRPFSMRGVDSEMMIHETGFIRDCRGVLLNPPRRFVIATIRGQPCPRTKNVNIFSCSFTSPF